MTEKRVPGAGWVYMIYDKADRLVLTKMLTKEVLTNGHLLNTISLHALCPQVFTPM